MVIIIQHREITWSYNSITFDLSIYCIISICVIQYGFVYLSDFDTVHFLRYPETISSLLISKEYWRVFSPVFIHFTLTHLLSNLLFFWIFATTINWYSRKILIILFLSSALISNFFQFLFWDEKFGGLSGVNFSLFGFVFIYQWLLPKGKLYVSRTLSSAIFLFLIVTSFTNLLGNYSIGSHISGLITGLVAGYYYATIDADKKL